MMPLVLFHLTIVIMLATSLHLILSILKFVKIYKEKEFLHLTKNTEENQKPIKISELIRRKVLSQQLENIQTNVKKLNVRLQKLNEAIEKESKDTQKLLQQYFRPYQWSKWNKW